MLVPTGMVCEKVLRRADLDPSPPLLSMFQMYRLTSVMLPRAVAQAVRAGRTREPFLGLGEPSFLA